VLPLQFLGDDSANQPGDQGDEEISIFGWATFIRSRKLMVEIKRADGSTNQIKVKSAHRHRDRGRLLQARRHPALRAARADLEAGPAKVKAA